MNKRKKAGNVAIIIMIVLLVLQVLVSYQDLIIAIKELNIQGILLFGVPMVLLIGAVIFMIKDRHKIE